MIDHAFKLFQIGRTCMYRSDTIELRNILHVGAQLCANSLYVTTEIL